MKKLFKILLCLLALNLYGACSSEKDKGNEAKTKSDHIYRSQFDALEKAKNLEKEIQDTYSEKLKGLEEQNQ